MGWASFYEDIVERAQVLEKFCVDIIETANKGDFATARRMQDSLETQLKFLYENLDVISDFLTDPQNDTILKSFDEHLKRRTAEKELKEERDTSRSAKVSMEKKIRELRGIIVEKEKQAKDLSERIRALKRKEKELTKLLYKAMELHPGLEYELYDKPGHKASN